MRHIAIPAFLLLVLLGGQSCGDEPTQGNTFDRKPMLEQYFDQLIVPAFDEFAVSTAALSAAFSAFEDTPDANTLAALRTAWLGSIRTWQAANCYNFGPADASGLFKKLDEELATFPINTEQVETYIAAGSTDMGNANRDTRGLLALDYLLYNASDEETLAALQGNAARMAYTRAVIQHLDAKASALPALWRAERSNFVAAAGTDVGSSTSALYNEFVRSFEIIKNFKVGLPGGFQAGQTQAEPQLAEAYYSGISLELIGLHLANIEAIYFGKSRLDGNNGVGFDDYLNAVVGGPELLAATTAQWSSVKTAFEAIPTDRPLAELMAEGHPAVANFHTELQKQTRFFKSDMSSLLGLAITFSSNDGD